MGDIITTFSKIGAHYLDDEKKVKNKAYEYDIIKVYLCDIKTKNISPNLNILKDDLIITRFGIGANSGNLFPNMFFEPKNIKDNFSKFVRGILKANQNLLSYFNEKELEGNEILGSLQSMDKTFFDDLHDKLLSLEKYKKEKGIKGKVATFFSLSYKDKPVSAYFKNIFEKHLNKSNNIVANGYDILTNKKGIGGDANLPFCSVNELPKNLQGIKKRLLPLSFKNAKQIKIGFDVMDKSLSHNFYGLKMAIMPTVLSNDKTIYGNILDILEQVNKGSISEIEESEININEYLEEVAHNEKSYPVLNTILFYNKNNAAVDMLMQIDDVLPSYISNVSDKMGCYNIKAFKDKDRKDTEETIYMQNLFGDRLEIMNILLSGIKIDKDILIEKFSQLIYWGNINKKYAYPVDWSKYFNGYYSHRSIDAIKKYLALFHDTKKLKKNFILQKEYSLQNSNDISKKIKTLMQNSEFLDNEVLKTAYLLGMLSSALINWQYGASGGSSSYNKWLNNSGAITRDSLERIWKKAEETIRKLNSTSGKGNVTVNMIKELVIEYSQKAFLYKGIVKSSYVSLSFAMGGSDYTKHIKNKNMKEK